MHTKLTGMKLDNFAWKSGSAHSAPISPFTLGIYFYHSRKNLLSFVNEKHFYQRLHGIICAERPEDFRQLRVVAQVDQHQRYNENNGTGIAHNLFQKIEPLAPDNEIIILIVHIPVFEEIVVFIPEHR